MKRRLMSLAIAFFVLAMSSVAAIADEPKEPYDARLEGYTGNKQVTLDGGSEALLWLLLIGLIILALGVMFKHAKRTHLD